MLVRTAKDLGATIRDRRKELGLDQAELASSIGVSREWLLRVEGGKSGASISLILKTLRALDLQMSVAKPGSASKTTETPLALPNLDDVLSRTRRTDDER